MGEDQCLISQFELPDAEHGSTGPRSRRAGLMHRIRLPSGSSLFKTIRQALFLLLPTFVQGSIRPSQQPESGKPLHPTAWLDGMRGLAAFFVLVQHLSYPIHDVFSAWTPEQGYNHFLRLPLIRFFYDGAFMVAIFFVLSGYALSYKPVRQMRNGEIDTLVQTLSSSVFRRAVRLYLPCFASTLLIVVSLRLGFYEWTRAIANDPVRLPASREIHFPRSKTASEQILNWAGTMLVFVNPFNPVRIVLDTHLWTIPIEFISSIILYVTQLALCRVSPRVRMLCIICLIALAHQTAHWSTMLFYGGFLLAELNIRQTERATSDRPNRLVWSFVYGLLFVCALYLGAQPERCMENAPGWATLISWIPAQFKDKPRYWTTWGALLLVWATSNSLPLQRIFTNRVSQYLGKISFSMYLLHGNIIHTFGYGSLDFFWGLVGRETYLQKETGFALAAICVLAATIWSADVFTRLVDTPSVKFAKWLEMRCLAEAPLDEKPAWREARALV